MGYEAQADVVLAGGMLIDDFFHPVYVRPETGEVVYEGADDEAAMMIDGVTITDPIQIPTAETTELALRSSGFGAGTIGIVYSLTKPVALLSERTAEYRSLVKLHEASGDTFEIDINTMDPNAEED